MPKFLAYWGEGYGLPTSEVHPLSWFNSEGGYSHADTWNISELEPLEILDFSDGSGRHFIVRVD
jgi:hypothetical protein